MRTKTTVQDIADALGLSRTTVSKVLNHSTAVSDATKTLVMNKARELNYRVLPQPTAAPPTDELKCFALVVHSVPLGTHMGTAAITALDQRIRQDGYSLVTCTISDDEMNQLTYPSILATAQVKAIVCMELFHPEYSRLLCSIGKPILFIDACMQFPFMGLNANLLLMDNRFSTYQMLNTLIENHSIRSMGFVGEPTHCISFRERYESFKGVAADHNVDTSLSILDEDRFYGNMDWLRQRLESMEHLPQLFFCANDFLASMLVQALDALGKRVPEDVMVCGFDGQISTDPIMSRLTTIATHGDQIGTYAATILLHKLVYHSDLRGITYIPTEVLFRETAPET